MADQDFNIKVVTTADTSGIRQTSAELDALAQKRQSGLLAPIPAGLSGVEDVESELERVATTTSTQVNPALNLAGVNLGKARQEAAVLVRELATGGNVTRTLGSLLGALGPTITAASLGGILIYEAIKKTREENQKLIDDSIKLGKEFEANAVKAQNAIQGARSGEDISKIAEGVIPELDKIHEHSKEVANKTLNFWQRTIEDMREGIVQLSPVVTPGMREWAHSMTRDLQEAQRQSEDNAHFEDVQAKNRIERAKDFKRQFELLKEIPVADAIEKTTDRLEDLTKQQDSLNKEGEDYVKSWLAIQTNIQQAKKDLADLIKLQDEQNKKEKAVKDAGTRASEAERKAAALAARPNQTGEQQSETQAAAQAAAQARAEAQRREDELREQKRAQAQKESDFAEVKKYGRVLDPSERASETIKEREELGQKAGQAQNKELQERLSDQMEAQTKGITLEQLKNEREAKGIKPTEEKDTSQGIIRAIEQLEQKFDRYWQ